MLVLILLARVLLSCARTFQAKERRVNVFGKGLLPILLSQL